MVLYFLKLQAQYSRDMVDGLTFRWYSEWRGRLVELTACDTGIRVPGNEKKEENRVFGVSEHVPDLWAFSFVPEQWSPKDLHIFSLISEFDIDDVVDEEYREEADRRGQKAVLISIWRNSNSPNISPVIHENRIFRAVWTFISLTIPSFFHFGTWL